MNYMCNYSADPCHPPPPWYSVSTGRCAGWCFGPSAHSAHCFPQTARKSFQNSGHDCCQGHGMRAVLSRTPDNELFVEDELRPTIPFVVSPKSNPFSLSVDAIESTLDCLVPLAMAQATQVLLKRNNHLLTTITPHHPITPLSFLPPHWPSAKSEFKSIRNN